MRPDVQNLCEKCGGKQDRNKAWTKGSLAGYVNVNLCEEKQKKQKRGRRRSFWLIRKDER